MGLSGRAKRKAKTVDVMLVGGPCDGLEVAVKGLMPIRVHIDATGETVRYRRVGTNEALWESTEHVIGSRS